MIKRKKRNRINFEVIPLIDVMMILAIFFAILAFLPQIQSSIETQLPKAGTSDKAEEAIVITINSNGNIFLEDQPLSKNELIAELKVRLQNDNTIPLLLAADKSLEYDSVVSVIDIMKSSGAVQVGLVTEE